MHYIDLSQPNIAYYTTVTQKNIQKAVYIDLNSGKLYFVPMT